MRCSRDGREVYIRQALQDLLCQRTLDGELTDVVAAVLEDSASGVVRLTPSPVLLDISGIDDEEVLLIFVVVDEEVVDDTPPVRWGSRCTGCHRP